MEDVNVLTDEQTTQVEEVKEVTEKSEVVETVETTEIPKESDQGKKKKETFEERTERLKREVDELTGKKYTLKKEIEELSKQKVSPERPKVPNIQKFVNDDGVVDEEKYNEAMAEYNERFFDFRETKKKQDEVVEVAKSEQENKQKNWEDVATKAIKKYPDLQEVTSKDVYNPVLIDVLRDKAKIDIEEETTVSADLAYYLGKNPIELAKINKLANNDPVNMIIELGKIHGKIESLTKNVSNAPKPLETLDAEKGSLKEFEDFPDGKDDEWFQWRKKQKLEKLKRK
jgi:hypothetical protein